MIPFKTIKVNYYTSDGTKESFTQLVNTNNPFLKVLTCALTKINSWNSKYVEHILLNPDFIRNLYKHNILNEIESDLLTLLPNPNTVNVINFLEKNGYEFNDKNWDFIVTLADLIYWGIFESEKPLYYDSFEI